MRSLGQATRKSWRVSNLDVGLPESNRIRLIRRPRSHQPRSDRVLPARICLAGRGCCSRRIPYRHLGYQAQADPPSLHHTRNTGCESGTSKGGFPTRNSGLSVGDFAGSQPPQRRSNTQSRRPFGHGATDRSGSIVGYLGVGSHRCGSAQLPEHSRIRSLLIAKSTNGSMAA